MVCYLRSPCQLIWDGRNTFPGKGTIPPSVFFISLAQDPRRLFTSLCIEINAITVKTRRSSKKYKDNNNDVRGETLKEEIEGLRQHTFLKNFDGSSKSTECDSIVGLVSNASNALRCYIREIGMDNDPSHQK